MLFKEIPLSVTFRKVTEITKGMSGERKYYIESKDSKKYLLRVADATNYMKKNKQWLLNLLILLFTVSVSVTVLPCGVIHTYGLFGEVTSSTVTDDAESGISDESQIFTRRKQVKGINIYNIWFEILIGIVCMIFVEYGLRLPRGDTIVTLKVRMDN